MTNKLKENWNAVDKICPSCGQVTEKTIGINKQNLKKLLWSKPTPQEITIFIMLVLCLSMVWSYNNEIKQYKEMASNPEGFCIEYYNKIIFQDMNSFDVNQRKNNNILSDLNISIQNG